ncbi:CcmD family protein [Portibacter lacus]|uniref:CcmD family protein n=1 Tax=Portibacter lacus TaxID=1099794 RepID=A0AA37WEN8_9BACT|nr:CcmD family protein [Portibacter lacus]GLR16290.1 hypothetical protein GCM10007940_09050 [Portibacter lacus]
MKYKLLLVLAIISMSINTAFAHGDGPDFFRSIGKIYVVVGVMVITFIGITCFLIYIDRKIKKIENEISSHN